MFNCEWNMFKRKQQTLGCFGFNKKVVHRGKEQEVKIPNFMDAEEAMKLISCLHCPQISKINKNFAFTLNANMQGKFY